MAATWTLCLRTDGGLGFRAMWIGSRFYFESVDRVVLKRRYMVLLLGLVGD